MRKLTDKQIAELMLLAKKAKGNGEPLVCVFKDFSKRYSLSAGSVRNVYYKSLKAGKGAKRGLTAKSVVPFTSEEEKQLIKKVLTARRNTTSMREAFLEVASGDEKLALRYQNKYSNMLKKQRSTVMREILCQKRISEDCFNPYIDKSNRERKIKLKREIDDLIKIIISKCEKENRELKRKLILYDKLTSYPFESVNEIKKESGVKQFFLSSAKQKVKGKVR